MLRFSKEHVWVKQEDGMLRVGLSDYAQQELGELTFIELPEVGTQVKAGDPVCTIDSLKSTSDVYAPLSGTVTATNDTLNGKGKASLINSDPMGEGWLFLLKSNDRKEFERLLTEAEYQKHVSG